MTPMEPQAEHKWLQKLVGEWTYETEPMMGCDGKMMDKCGGTEHVRSLGGLWVVADGKGEMPGGMPATMQMTLGYDPQKKRYTGTWVGSMMTHLWVYDGELDASGRVLSLHADGPSMSGDGKMAKYKDVITLHDDNRRTLTGNMLGDDGKWVTFMTANYKRVR